MIPPTSRSNRQMDSGALVSSLEVSRVSLGKSCCNQFRRAGLWARRVHCSPNQLRCCKSPLCSRMEPTDASKLLQRRSTQNVIIATWMQKIAFLSHYLVVSHTSVPFGQLREIWSHGVNGTNVIIGNKGRTNGGLWSKQEFKQRVLPATVPKRLHHLHTENIC